MLAVCVSANHRYVQTFLSARVSMWQHCVYGLLGLVTKTKPASVAQSRLETSLKLVRNSFLSRVSVTVSAGNIRLLIESLQFWSMVSSLCWHETWIYLCFQHFNMSFLWRRLLLHMFCLSDLHRDGELRPVPGEAGQSGLMVPGCPSICPEQLFRVRDPRQRAAVRVWREEERGREGCSGETCGTLGTIWSSWCFLISQTHDPACESISLFSTMWVLLEIIPTCDSKIDR